MMLAIVVLGAVLASAVSAGQIRGLPRSLEPLYAGVNGKFTCLDGSKSIALAQINDDFCDCKDGSDEPGTSACSAGKFYCPNKGYRGKYITALLVNDGVCDCCDGSDEWNGRVTCTNTCDVDGAEWRRQQADAIRKAEEGARLRQLYADEGRKQASERKSKIDVLEAALEKAKVAKEEAEQAVVKAEEREKEEGAKAVENASAAARASVVSSLKLEQFTREDLLDLIFEHARDTSTGPALVTAINEMRGVAADAADAAVWPTDAPAAASEYKSPEANKAREARTAAQSELSRLEGELRAVKEDETADFGPDNAFWKLKGKCSEIRVNNQYTYSVCPFGAAKQDGTSLGTFAGWGKLADGSSDYSAMQFSNGAYCWNGPNRSMKLLFECGDTEAILSVDEPEKCTYTARFTTPAACDAKFARELQLELEQTGESGSHLQAHDEL